MLRGAAADSKLVVFILHCRVCLYSKGFTSLLDVVLGTELNVYDSTTFCAQLGPTEYWGRTMPPFCVDDD